MSDSNTTSTDTDIDGTTDRDTHTTTTSTIATADLEYTPSENENEDTNESDGPPFVCSRCTRPFAHKEWLDLHRGLAHENDLTTDEREAFTDAYETEEEDLRLFRLKALIVLIAVYFGFIITYSIFA